MRSSAWVLTGLLLAFGSRAFAAVDKTDITYSAEARSCKEVLADLSRQTGLELKADLELAECKLTLAVRTMPSDRLRDCIAKAVNGEWTRDRADGERLTLRPTAERVAALREARTKKLERRQALIRPMGSMLDLGIAGRVGGTGNSFDQVRREAYAVVKHLPRDTIYRAILNPNPPPTGTSVDKMPCVSIRASTLSPEGKVAFARLVGQIVADAETRGPASAYLRQLPARSEELLLEFWSNEATPRSGGNLTLSLRDPTSPSFGTDIWIAGASYPKANVPANPVLPGEQGMAKQQAFPANAREATLVELPRGSWRYDHALVQLCAAAKVDLVADYFTRGKLTKWSGGRRQLVQVLDEMESELGLEHEWKGSTLIVRTGKWAESVDMEPTAEVVRRMEKVAGEPEGPELGDLLFVAAQSTDERLTVLGFHTDPDGKRLPATLAPRIRKNATWLRAYASLTQAEAKLAGGASGLKLNRLPVKTRARWEQALTRSSVYFPSGELVILKVTRDARSSAYKDWPNVPAVKLGSPSWPLPVELWQSVSLY